MKITNSKQEYRNIETTETKSFLCFREIKKEFKCWAVLTKKDKNCWGKKTHFK